ncbi:uncharacterized protein LOC143851181 [Tasmannia lanceolata]|uniref:uncharacterized protein LOC143851181 n=1 Tax=Tasmannia lanceolata TaxID=3420 RepID=UPI00406439C0
MGSGSSRLGSRPCRSRVNRGKRRLAPFICGGSRSHAPHQMEDDLAEVLTSSVAQQDSIADDTLKSSAKKSSLIFSSANDHRSIDGNGKSCESRNGTHEDMRMEYGSRSLETSDVGKCLSERKELVPCQENAGYSIAESYRQRTSDIASTSKDLQPVESAPKNVETWLGPLRSNDTINEGSSSQQEPGDSHANGVSAVENHEGEVSAIPSSDSNSISAVSDSSVALQSLRDESIGDATPSIPASLLYQGNGSVLNVDMVSISSNILGSSSGEMSGREARRNSRRLFWDAFSRRSSRRHSDSPVIVFSTEGSDDLGSHDRWLLDFSGDLFDNGIGDDLGYFSSRSHGRHGRRWHSRSEFWERLRGGLDESSGRTTFCASGLHPAGTCSCETFLMAEESGTRASISRIVMLAEALFEVLDELHRQPVSLSLSMMSRPAPESVVNSFPLKNHKKTTSAENGDDVEQCYICLIEYEEGDEIRVLPCHHEYHMSCVDKWLKEIHGVCPLCRGDVCAGGV